MKLFVSFLRNRRLGRRGTAAVEFALTAPLLLILFIGTQEMLLLYRTQAKLNAMAASVAQMVSLQGPATTATPVIDLAPAQIADVCQGAVDGLQPFPPFGLSIAVASLTKISDAGVDANGKPVAAKYDYWENDAGCAGAATATPIAASSPATGICTASGELTNPYDNIIEVRGTLNYPGVVGLILGSAPTLQETAFARWRYANTFPANQELTCSGCAPPALPENCS